MKMCVEVMARSVGVVEVSLRSVWECVGVVGVSTRSVGVVGVSARGVYEWWE